MRLYNTQQLLPDEARQQIARVTLSAFLEATLHDQTGYLPLFRDPRAGAAWLPDTVYLARCGDSATRLAATFDDDLDLTTGSLPGVTLQGDNLTTWREGRPLTRELTRLRIARFISAGTARSSRDLPPSRCIVAQAVSLRYRDAACSPSPWVTPTDRPRRLT